MKNKIDIKLYFLVILSIIPSISFAQALLSNAYDSSFVSEFILREQLSIETDRSLYIAGETILFSCLSYEQKTAKTISLSAIAYVELFNAENTVIRQLKITLKEGIGSGYINIPKDILSGTYYVRIYTNYMKNFGCEHFKTIPVQIINPFIHKPIEATNVRNSELKQINIAVEGGNIIRNTNNRIVCSFNDSMDKLCEAKAKIYSDNGELISTQQTNQYGIITFNLKPTKHNSYYIRAKGIAGPEMEKQIIIKDSSLNLSILNENKDTVFLKINGTSENTNLTINAYYNSNLIYKNKIRNRTVKIAILRKKLSYGINTIELKSEEKPLSSIQYLNSIKNKSIPSIETQKTIFKVNDKINFSVKNLMDTNSFYSISITLTDSSIQSYLLENTKQKQIISQLFPLLKSTNHNLSNFDFDSNYLQQLIIISANRNKSSSPNPKSFQYDYLPETKEDLVFGKTGNISYKNIIIRQTYIDSILRIQNTLPRANGKFTMPIKTKNENEIIAFSTLNNESKINMQEEFSSEFYNINKTNNTLPKGFKNIIEQLMLNVQIKDALSIEDTSTHYNKISNHSFYGKADKIYIIKEYVAIKTFDSFVFEVIPWLSNLNINGNNEYRISYKGTDQIIGDKPLFTIDGISVFNPQNLNKIPCDKIKSIAIVYNKVFLQNEVYDGVVEITSVEGNGKLISDKEPLNTFYFKGIQKPFKLTNSKTFTTSFSNLLFYRSITKVRAQNKTNHSFKASQIPGRYQIRLSTYSGNGKIENHYKYITIE